MLGFVGETSDDPSSMLVERAKQADSSGKSSFGEQSCPTLPGHWAVRLDATRPSHFCVSKLRACDTFMVNVLDKTFLDMLYMERL